MTLYTVFVIVGLVVINPSVHCCSWSSAPVQQIFVELLVEDEVLRCGKKHTALLGEAFCQPSHCYPHMSAPACKTAACGVTMGFWRHLRRMVERLLGRDGGTVVPGPLGNRSCVFLVGWVQSTYAAYMCPAEALLGCSCGKVVWVAGQFVPMAIIGRLCCRTA